MFFVPFNVLFFKEGQKLNNNLQHITFYWAIMIISGILGPLAGGYILQKFGINYFVFTALVILFIVVYLVKYLPIEIYNVTKEKLSKTLKGFRTINLLDGALHKVGIVSSTLLSLRFITSEISFGQFLSLVSVVALIFSFQTAKLSDRINKRMIFIWPLSIASAITIFALYFTDNLYIFLGLALTLKALTVMLEPIRSNILQDKADKNNPLIWIARELYLNAGRSIFWLTAFILWYFNLQIILFIIMGFLYLFFPMIVHHKKIYAAIN
jgi:hypothetical protein